MRPDERSEHDARQSRGSQHPRVRRPFLSQARIAGPDPERTSYASYASFEDPDGNGWTLQEITTRLPGREPTS